jgi:tetratricopeptide (TPR) repeat protein/O-antigen ligase
MEAAWLAAVCIVPIFFNVYSSRIFEPDKITILRSLALLTLGAWIVKLIEEGGVKWKDKPQQTSYLEYLWNYPLLAPVFSLIIVYILASIFSVTPSISFFGSYQRLQGTYTTLSYVVIFFSILGNLRTRKQINRLITTIILASLPVSLYGLLQRYQIDPIPWGGNVSIRIAANMGNSIFVAAYLIMVFPLTIGRIIEVFREILRDDYADGTARSKRINQILRATFYIFIAGLQLVAIYMSGSRGPLLGLMVSIYLLILLLAIYWRKRWLTFTVVGIAIFGATFLILFNLQNSPFERLKSSPAIGRFGKLLDPESNSALVRQYIWEGTVKLVGIHEPLKFPDGHSDNFNFLRPILGYGPESMYVAYNQYYQPELGQVEKRNASPDRAHNETWDSIVITGIAGLLVYLTIFCSIFYYGLKWLGLINNNRRKTYFFICLMCGGLIGTISLIIARGIEFLGVGLPFGLILGVIVYLTSTALFLTDNKSETNVDNPYSLWIIFLFSAIIGHFVEINFGISIVATRTLFWAYTGVMLAIGYVLPRLQLSETETVTVDKTNDSWNLPTNSKKNKQKTNKPRHLGKSKIPSIFEGINDWIRYSLVCASIIGIIIATLGYDYVTNSGHSMSPGEIIFVSLTQLVNQNYAFSYGVLILVVTTWIVGVLLFLAEYEKAMNLSDWLKTFGLISMVSLAIGLVFWILHAISMAILASFTPANQSDVIQQVNNIGSLLSKYYLYILIIILSAAFQLPDEWPQKGNIKSPLGVVMAPIILVGIMILVNITNLRVIHADITFKMAEPFTKSNKWQVATFLYKRALQLAPKEDHYYLYLGRSYLEQAKVTESIAEQDKLILQAENDLTVAQSINPLNTDHTANLARLYSWWAGKSSSINTRAERAGIASDYYKTALTLSPNNSTLWDEWSILAMQVMGDPQEAFEKLNRALELDSQYSFTLGLLGDYHLRQASSAINIVDKREALQAAANYYRNAAEVSKPSDQTPKSNYLLSLANVYIMMAELEPGNIDRGQLQQAIEILLESMDARINPNDLWKVQEAIAKLYIQLGDAAHARYYATQALNGAPDSAINRIQEIITRTLTSP